MSVYPISMVDPGLEVTLPEYRVGMAYERFVFPGIAQCFAVIGKRQSFMIGTHVSPGAHADGVADTFKKLRDLGGREVQDWYVVGPCGVHFAQGENTAWKSVQDIRQSFTDHFPASAADHYIMDITILRNQKVPVNIGGQMHDVVINAVDVRADYVPLGNKVEVSYRTHHRDRGDVYGAWQRLNPWLYKRF